jgi:hypothetical protein
MAANYRLLADALRLLLRQIRFNFLADRADCSTTRRRVNHDLLTLAASPGGLEALVDARAMASPTHMIVGRFDVAEHDGGRIQFNG